MVKIEDLIHAVLLMGVGYVSLKGISILQNPETQKLIIYIAQEVSKKEVKDK